MILSWIEIVLPRKCHAPFLTHDHMHTSEMHVLFAHSFLRAGRSQVCMWRVWEEGGVGPFRAVKFKFRTWSTNQVCRILYVMDTPLFHPKLRGTITTSVSNKNNCIVNENIITVLYRLFPTFVSNKSLSKAWLPSRFKTEGTFSIYEMSKKYPLS